MDHEYITVQVLCMFFSGHFVMRLRDVTAEGSADVLDGRDAVAAGAIGIWCMSR